MRNLLKFFIVFSTINNIEAQTFTATNDGVFITPDVSYSDVGDYDNDGDLDIVLIGSDSGTYHLKIYDNDGSGNFSLSTTSFSDVYRNGQVEFVDYDNDNDLDVFVSGWNNLVEKSALYRNDNGVFFEISAPFGQNIANSQFSWSDLDNDGDLDLILSGNYQTFDDYIYVYRNDSNDVFTLMSTSILAHSQGKTLLGDLDNDGDNDVIIGGLNIPPFEANLQVYKNNGNFNFTLQATLERYMNGDSELRDCNGDGLIDITKTGFASAVSVSTKVYLNNGDFTFTDFNGMSSFPVSNNMNLVSADYNGNGELDFLITEQSRTSIFVNSGNMNLTESVSTGIPPARYNDVEIADFDNDHDVDVFVMNDLDCKTYINQATTSNTVPSTPTSLNSQVTGNNVELNWGGSTDLESPNKQISYNLYVGSAPASIDIVTPMSNITNGYRKIVNIGNAQYKNSFKLSDLESGTYYWSVQAIDNQYEGSQFAPEQTFTITGLGLDSYNTQQSIFVYPNPVNDLLYIQTNLEDYTVLIHNSLGQEVLKCIKNQNAKLNIKHLESGLYLVNLKKGDKTQVIKLFKL